jgi:hypothetical protein
MLARALFVLLIVLNLGVAAWWLWHEPGGGAAMAGPEGNVPRLELPSERASAVAADAGVEQAAPAVPLPADAVCVGLGPFADAATAVAAQTRLASQVLQSRIVERSVGTVRGWRVLVPPLPGATEAEAMAERIAAAGFTDYFVMRRGADTNAVALGRYQSESAARRRADALVAAGFPARAEPLGATLQPWLEVALPAGTDPTALPTVAGVAQSQPLACDTLQ